MKASSTLRSIRYVAAIVVGTFTFGFLITLTSAACFQLAHLLGHSGFVVESPQIAAAFFAPMFAVVFAGWLAPDNKVLIAKAIAAYIALFLAVNLVRALLG